MLILKYENGRVPRKKDRGEHPAKSPSRQISATGIVSLIHLRICSIFIVSRVSITKGRAMLIGYASWLPLPGSPFVSNLDLPQTAFYEATCNVGYINYTFFSPIT